MARNALVIKGANFITNKVATVDIEVDDKPCTSITLSQSSKTVTELGSFSLTATVTPADTTDEVLWMSSNTSVATVSNGTVNVIGIGSATITASCGSQSATCTVTLGEITLNVDYGFFKYQDLASYPNMYAYATSKRELLIHSLTGTGKLLKNQTIDATLRYPIPIPGNVSKIKLTYGSDMRAGTIYFGWMDSTTSPYPSQYPDHAYCVSLDSSNRTAYNQAKTWEYEVPEGADSFAIIITPVSSDYAESDTPEGIAQAKGIVIKASA